MLPEYLTIGKIAKPQGIRGEVIINVETDFPSRFFDQKVFLVRLQHSEPIELIAENVRMHKDRIVLKFQGINDRNAAEELRDREIVIPIANRYTQDEDFYYHFELVGMIVISTEGKTLGTVSEVMTGTGQDVLVVKDKGREILIPFHKDICIDVNREEKKIIASMPEGLEIIND